MFPYLLRTIKILRSLSTMEIEITYILNIGTSSEYATRGHGQFRKEWVFFGGGGGVIFLAGTSV